MKTHYLLLTAFCILSLSTFAQSGTMLPDGFIMPNLSIAPGCTVADKGKMYFNTTSNSMMYCDGLVWKPAVSQWNNSVSPTGAINYGLGNVGIGTTSPAYKLDVAGRLRLQHSTNTAGIWLDGSTLPTRSFIGTINDDHVGIYGNGGIGWNFAMNVNNGNIGIGTATPTAKLDVNGNVRIRGSFPKKGSVLTSDDSNGNASWTDPVAFKASGRNAEALPTVPLATWTKFFFETTPDFNIGFVYQPLSSQIGVVEDGIYHLNTQIQLFTYGESLSVRLWLKRGNTERTIAEQNKSVYSLENPPTLSDIIFVDAVSISTDVMLLAGDIVWVEFYYNSSYNNAPFPLSTLNNKTWFSGHLVARL